MHIRKRFPAITRQNLYIVSDAAARVALIATTLIDGDLVLQKDTDELFEYDSSVPGFHRIGGKQLAFTYTDGNSLNFTYTAATQVLTAEVIPSPGAQDANYQKVDLNVQADGLRAQIADEAIQDAAFGTLFDTDSVDLNYDDALGRVTADVRVSADAADLNYLKAEIAIQSGASKGLRVQLANALIRGLFSGTSPITYNSGTGAFGIDQTAVDHGTIGGLSDDDHAQYALLAGRAGGQTQKGGTAASENLQLESTAHGTKGLVISLDDFQAQKAFRLKLAADNSSAGTVSDLATTNIAVIRLTSATTLESIAGGADSKLLIVMNTRAGTLTVKNDTGGTLGNRIVTGTGADIILQSGGSLFFAYDPTASRWRVIGGAGGGGYLVNATQSLNASGTVSIGASGRQIAYVQGNAAAITLDTTTPISAGTIDGQELKIVGRSDTNTVTILNGGNVRTNGSMTIGDGESLDLFWDATNSVWRESARSE